MDVRRCGTTRVRESLEGDKRKEEKKKKKKKKAEKKKDNPAPSVLMC